MIVTHKRGDTFSWGGTYGLTDEAGQPLPDPVIAMASQIRTPTGRLIADLQIDYADGAVILRAADTQEWPEGVAHMDVQVTVQGGDVISSPTTLINIIKDVTRP